MSAYDRRISKLERESKYRTTKHPLLVERYPEPLEEAKMEADLTCENENDYQIIFMSREDAATL